MVLGLSLLGYAVNVFIFAMGRLWSAAPPILGAKELLADPLPQALVLTAIVIGFATTGFVIELALRSRHDGGSDHVDGREPTRANPDELDLRPTCRSCRCCCRRPRPSCCCCWATTAARTRRHGHRKLLWARRLALGSVLLGLVIAAALVVGRRPAASCASTWWANGRRLSASCWWSTGSRRLMLLLTSLVALPVLWYATGGWDSHGRYFHALFQFQLMGLNGAFVTGDLFNLFVFFEVLLIASYVLMVHGQGRRALARRLALRGAEPGRVGAVPDRRVAAVRHDRHAQPGRPGAARAQGARARCRGGAGRGLLLLVVFGFKAALLPLSLWLPATYAAASAPVAALFAIMTKVGVYAILRVHGVVFGADAGASAYTVEPLLLPLALGTSVLGVLGAWPRTRWSGWWPG